MTARLVAERPVVPLKPGNAGREGTGLGSKSELEVAREILVNAVKIQELRKVPQTEVKEEPEINSGSQHLPSDDSGGYAQFEISGIRVE